MYQNNISTTIIFLLTAPLFALTLTACYKPAEDPKAVAEKYWTHMQTGNPVEAEKLVSINSRRAFNEQQGQLATIDQLQTGEAVTTVETTITTIDPDTKRSYAKTFDTVLVLQQGEWKVDAEQTHPPLSPSAKQKEMEQLADKLSKSMQDNVDSIDEAMEQGMEMLNEALRDSSKDMGDSLLKLMNELNSSMQQSIEKMKKRHQQQQEQEQLDQAPTPQTPAPAPAPDPDPAQGEGMI